MPTTQAPDGTELFFTEAGDGPPVVLVHGITESHESWQPVIDRLAATHRVIAMDLRGHGRSAHAASYDLASMAGDVIAVAQAAGADQPHLVGHSLGGAVVSAVGATGMATSVTAVDQSLDLAAFKAALLEVESMLRDPETFPLVIAGLFDQMAGTMLDPDERSRIDALRRPDQSVALGVWGLLLEQNEEEVAATVDAALAGYATPYLALFGIDPGDGYEAWLQERIDGAVVEVWPEHGHYPHLVDPDRFVERLQRM
ncbi:MAG: alpha/beta fold hydrolase [Acidimicrobiales bacterium]